MPEAAPHQPQRPVALLRIALHAGAALLIVLNGTSARAIDLSDNGLDTETIARRDLQAKFDNRTRFGAQRVNERPHGEPDALGIRAGSFLIYPTVGTAVVFDNNIFGSNAERKSDVRAEIRPEITLRSELPRHRLDMSVGGKIVEYVENTDQSYADAHASAVGALHFDAAHTLSASMLTSLEHEERQDSTAYRFAIEPAQVWHNRAAVGITRDVGRLYGTLSGAWEAWKFYDVAVAGGSTAAMSSRDLDAFSGMFSAGYRISPGYDAVARMRIARFLNDGDGKTSRSGTGYEALAGIAFEASPLVRFRLLGGWGVRDFDQTGLATTQSWIAEGELQWLVTQTLTFYATGGRSIVDQLATDGTSQTVTSLRARLEYEIWHNLVLNMGAGYSEAEFSGTTRTDRTYTGKIGLDYYANNNWVFTFGYEHQVRDSTDSNRDMTRDRFTVGAKLQF